jgi:type IV secretory pathway TraG/TraD family ATPase VirD4
MPEANLEQKIMAPATRLAELVSTACSEIGWHVEKVWLNQLSAALRRTQRVSGLSANYEYRLRVKWGEILPNKSSWVQVRVLEQEDRMSEKALVDLGVEVLSLIAEKATDLEEAEAAAKPSQKYGSARWANPADLESAGYIADKPGVGRLIIGPTGDGRLIAVDNPGTLKHALVIGPTGSGKSSKIIKAQAILRLEESMLITEATPGNQPPDVYSSTATWRARMGGQKIFYFNPDDLHSNQINPLDQVTTFEKALELTNLIVDNTGGKTVGGEKMWVDGERHLLTALLIYVRGEKGHLGMVRNLMREGPDGVGRLINAGAYQEAINEYRLFVKNTTEGIRNGIASGLLQRLNLWVNPKIVKLTERTDFDVSGLLKEKFTFYLAVPAQKRMVKPLAALIFNFVLNLLLEQKAAHPVSFVLDEFTNFGRIDGIEELISIIRQRGIPILFGCQNFLQLKKVYGLDDAGILYSQTSSKFIFKAQDLETAKKVSDSLGRQTVVDRNVSDSGRLTVKEFGRPLMEPGELMEMQDMIVFTPGSPPLKTKGFTWQDFTYATNLPPYERRMLEIDDRLTEVCAKAATRPDWAPETPPVFTEPLDEEEQSEQKSDEETVREQTTEAQAKEEPKKSRKKPRRKPKELERRMKTEPEHSPEPEPQPDLEPVIENPEASEAEEESPEYD